jgi:hypothetical protein
MRRPSARSLATFAFAALVAGAMGLAPSPAHAAGPKRLIEMGWDEPDPAFLRAHAAEMDTMPFDGVVFHVPYVSPGGKTGNFTWETWGPHAFTEADLAGAIADVQAAHFRRLRSNLLRVNVTPGTVGWFDDPAPVLSNFRLAARVAKRMGLPGILLDTEPYGKPLFLYRDQPDARAHPFPAYAAQVRRRGRAVMRALEEGYPGLTVFLTVGPTWAVEESLWSRARFDTTRFGLLTPFVDGMILGASGTTRIVDGTEASYPVRAPSELDQYKDLQRRLVLPWITDRVRYRKYVSMSYGIWLDHDWRHRGWNAEQPERNYRTPAQLESTLVRALSLADDYVWLYSETPRWWSPAGGPVKLPTAYVEAVRRARATAGP